MAIKRVYVPNLQLKIMGWMIGAMTTATLFGYEASTVAQERRDAQISESDVRNDPDFMTRYRACLSDPATPKHTSSSMQQVEAMEQCEGKAIAQTRLAIAAQRYPDQYNAQMVLLLIGCSVSMAMALRLKAYGTDEPPKRQSGPRPPTL